MTDFKKLEPALKSEIDALVADYKTKMADCVKRQNELHAAYVSARKASEQELLRRIPEISDLRDGAILEVTTQEAADDLPIKVYCSGLKIETDGLLGRDHDLELSIKAKLETLTKDGNVSRNSRKLNLSMITSVNGRPCRNGFRTETEKTGEILAECSSEPCKLWKKYNSVSKKEEEIYEHFQRDLRVLSERLPIKQGERYPLAVQFVKRSGVLVSREEEKNIVGLCECSQLRFDGFGETVRPYYSFRVYGKRFLTDEKVSIEENPHESASPA